MEHASPNALTTPNFTNSRCFLLFQAQKITFPTLPQYKIFRPTGFGNFVLEIFYQHASSKQVTQSKIGPMICYWIFSFLEATNTNISAPTPFSFQHSLLTFHLISSRCSLAGLNICCIFYY